MNEKKFCFIAATLMKVVGKMSFSFFKVVKEVIRREVWWLTWRRGRAGCHLHSSGNRFHFFFNIWKREKVDDKKDKP